MNETTDITTKASIDRSVVTRMGIFVVSTIVAGLFVLFPLQDLMGVGRSDYYSHILLIPFVSAYFLFEQRKAVLSVPEYGPLSGAVLMTFGIALYLAAFRLKAWLGVNDFASLAAAGSVVFWWGAFVLAFGIRMFRMARFPLLFALFLIPVPEFLLDRFIHVLQVGSTEVTQWLFEVTGTNYIRDGFVYRLTGINIEVAKECSGIRSTMALIITGVVAGHLFLRSGWRKLWLLIAMLPITIIKNGIRIVTLSLLAIYVDRKFITDSFLHHSGGFLFYVPALLMLGIILIWLRKGERKQRDQMLDEGV